MHSQCLCYAANGLRGLVQHSKISQLEGTELQVTCAVVPEIRMWVFRVELYVESKAILTDCMAHLCVCVCAVVARSYAAAAVVAVN